MILSNALKKTYLYIVLKVENGQTTVGKQHKKIQKTFSIFSIHFFAHLSNFYTFDIIKIDNEYITFRSFAGKHRAFLTIM